MAEKEAARVINTGRSGGLLGLTKRWSLYVASQATPGSDAT
ncbi:MAG TPA: hypothetical protein VMH03_09895 [Terriglobales bacterium]|nr:hypothetical protein [Terriglobales bacterium]